MSTPEGSGRSWHTAYPGFGRVPLSPRPDAPPAFRPTRADIDSGIREHISRRLAERGCPLRGSRYGLVADLNAYPHHAALTSAEPDLFWFTNFDNYGKPLPWSAADPDGVLADCSMLEQLEAMTSAGAETYYQYALEGIVLADEAGTAPREVIPQGLQSQKRLHLHRVPRADWSGYSESYLHPEQPNDIETLIRLCGGAHRASLIEFGSLLETLGGTPEWYLLHIPVFDRMQRIMGVGVIRRGMFTFPSFGSALGAWLITRERISSHWLDHARSLFHYGPTVAAVPETRLKQSMVPNAVLIRLATADRQRGRMASDGRPWAVLPFAVMSPRAGLTGVESVRSNR